MGKKKVQVKKAASKKIKSDKKIISKIVKQYKAGIECDSFGWYNN